MTPSTTPASPLTPAQQRALALLSTGATATAAANFVGVHRNTVRNWLRSAPFRDALAETRREQDLAWREQSRSLMAQALGTFQAVLDHPQAPATGPSRNQPCPCGSGRKFKRCCMSAR
jgi:uncharacterized protein YchJ